MTPTDKHHTTAVRGDILGTDDVVRDVLDSLACGLQHLGDAYARLASVGYVNTQVRSDIHASITYATNAGEILKDDMLRVKPSAKKDAR